MTAGEASFDIKPGCTSYSDQSWSSSAEETQAIQRAGPGVDLALLTPPPVMQKALLAVRRRQLYLPDGPSSPGAPFSKV